MDVKARNVLEADEPDVEASLAIGSILVRQGRLRQHDIDPVLDHAAKQGLKFGESAVDLKLLREEDVELALAHQFRFPVTFAKELGVSPEVVAAYDPQGAVAESIKALRSQLMLRYMDQPKLKSIAIISAERGEGRSWLAANLAVSFAQAGERTLLVDGDLRNPRQHELFNLHNSLGLSALLSNRASASTVQRLHPDLRLFLLSAGVSPPNPQELLAQPSCAFSFGRFAKQFSVMIFDTPSMSDSADAQLITARAGAALLVARRNKTRYSKLTAFAADLRELGANIVGTVLTDF